MNRKRQAEPIVHKNELCTVYVTYSAVFDLDTNSIQGVWQ